MTQNGPKWPKKAQNGPKRAPNGRNGGGVGAGLRRLYAATNPFRLGPFCAFFGLQSRQTGPKWPTEWPNSPKWPKMAQNDPVTGVGWGQGCAVS